MTFLSGSFFSPEAFPEVLQRVADVLPLTYYIQVVRDVMLKGEALWSDPAALAVMAAWGVAGALVALRSFSWMPRALMSTCPAEPTRRAAASQPRAKSGGSSARRGRFGATNRLGETDSQTM